MTAIDAARERLAFLLDTVGLEAEHLRDTDGRLFAEAFTAERAATLRRDAALSALRLRPDLRPRAQPGNVPGSRMPLSTCSMRVRPQKAIVRSSSLWMICSALVTPSSPIAPRP